MSPFAPDLSWLTDDLAVGGSFPGEAPLLLAAEHGVGAVVDLRSEACDNAAALHRCGLWFLHLPTDDHCAVSQAGLEQGVAYARTAARAERKLLVHCQHGIGRSALLALCVLVDRGWTPLAALRHAKDRRERVSPSPAQFDAWAAWLRTRLITPPSFEAFTAVAYRHLATA